MCAASTGPTKEGIGCCGSPTERLITGLPGFRLPMSSARRTNGERASAARAVDAAASRSAFVMDMDKTGAPAAWKHLRSGKVKARLTIARRGFFPPPASGASGGEGGERSEPGGGSFFNLLGGSCTEHKHPPPLTPPRHSLREW